MPRVEKSWLDEVDPEVDCERVADEHVQHHAGAIDVPAAHVELRVRVNPFGLRDNRGVTRAVRFEVGLFALIFLLKLVNKRSDTDLFR